MCGIAGIWDGLRCLESGAIETVVRNMASALTHRGPDDSGVWVDSGANIALSHRRLSIVDLSAEGHQPMISRSGRYVIVFNGEIYNHRALRADLLLRNCQFRGHSDTEVMLECIAEHGVE